jgi:streptogramin lyase
LGQADKAWAWKRGNVDVFAVLPDGSSGPEGLAVAPNGDVYVATFGFNALGEVPGPGQLFTFDRNGKLLRQVSVQGSSPHLLGLGLNPVTGALLVADLGGGQVLSVDPESGASATFMTVTGSPGLNAMTFDQAGNVYVSDSFQGIIWKTGPNGGVGIPWVTSPLLNPEGVPPFGANGLRFNAAGDTLFVANTATDKIIRIPVIDGNPGVPEVFTNSVNGADGLVIDPDGNLWVAANQGDEIVVVDPAGKMIAKLGDFDGEIKKGAPEGLLFPATPEFSKDGRSLFVTNLALDLRVAGSELTLQSGWADQVTRYTISRIKADIRH